ncbi:MAG: FHA domain-containing protein [Fimbriimonadaceae bacterium]|nr:FHA domain-containing protein [Fimbriimonadaceae bacterium]
MFRAVLLLCILAASGIASAATLTLNFTTPGPRLAWIAPGPLADPPETARKTEKFEIELETVGHAPTERIYVLDEATGNLAERPLKDVTDSWTVESAAFKRIAMARLRIESGGEPVAAAQVSVTNAGRTDEFLLDPSMRGVIRLPNLTPPEVAVRIRFNRDGKPTESKQIFPIRLKRSEPVPELVASIAGAATASPETAPSANDAQPSDGKASATAEDGTKPDSAQAKADDSGGGIQLGNILGFLVGLGIVIGGGYLLLQYYNKNKSKVDAELENLGVQIPKPGDAPLSSGNPVPLRTPQAPIPVQKIQLDPTASDPIAGDPLTGKPVTSAAPGGISLAGPAVAAPSLVSLQGDVIPLEPVTTVGREAGLGLSLTTESTVSRRHAELRLSGPELIVTDLGSSNGTYVNGQRITAPTPVRPGDRVQFGEVAFRFEAPRP